MPLKFIRSSYAQELVNETKMRVREEMSRMSEKELEDHLEYTKGLYESFKLEGNNESKVLYHELKLIRSEYTRRINKKNAFLARQYEKLKGSKKIIKCPHCKKQVDIKI